VQVARGSWEDAERELTSVIERLSSSHRTSRLDAVAQLGELRRRQGRFEEADALFAQAEFHPLSIVGRARMRLAKGDPASAWTMIRNLLERLPADSRLARSEVLLPATLIAEAAGEDLDAGQFVDELRQTAALTGSLSMSATATAASAVIAGDGEAVSLLSAAVQGFNESGLPYDEAQARLSLVEVLLASGDRDSARHHLARAVKIFSELSARDDLARAQCSWTRPTPRRAAPSRRGNGTCSRSWRRARATSRSRVRCSSANTPCIGMWRTSSPSSVRPRAPAPRRTPFTPG
jgi:tetratricopeptide (TPR) repeat protein